MDTTSFVAGDVGSLRKLFSEVKKGLRCGSWVANFVWAHVLGTERAAQVTLHRQRYVHQ